MLDVQDNFIAKSSALIGKAGRLDSAGTGDQSKYMWLLQYGGLRVFGLHT